jgi:DNA-directed RNA polymerase subunit RPC12/RpoP
MSDGPRCKCGEKLRTRSSRACGDERQRYVRCPRCGARGVVFVKTTVSEVRFCKGAGR